MILNEIIELLGAFGITASSMPFLILAILMVACFIWIKTDIGKKINKVSHNVVVITTHLCGGVKGKLDSGLLKQMSPLQIQPAGLKVLHDSGFVQAFNSNKEKFFSVVEELKPNNKLEVENYSIYSFIQVFNKDTSITKVKDYLYEHPNIRDTFTALAGVFIRDKYLEKKNIK